MIRVEAKQNIRNTFHFITVSFSDELGSNLIKQGENVPRLIILFQFSIESRAPLF